jgi:hypothetical protein
MWASSEKTQIPAVESAMRMTCELGPERGDDEDLSNVSGVIS